MTHEYTLLIGGVVVPGGDGGDPASVAAIAWAADTVLALGSDAEVRAISRGDSHFVELAGAWVVPLGADGVGGGRLEVGGPADLAVQTTEGGATLAIIRGGQVVSGSLGGTPGWDHHRDEAGAQDAPGDPGGFEGPV